MHVEEVEERKASRRENSKQGSSAWRMSWSSAKAVCPRRRRRRRRGRRRRRRRNDE